MAITVEAVYENGVFRPLTLFFDLKEGQEVYLQVEPVVELDPEEYKRRHAELLRRMEAEGLLETEPPSDEEEDKDEPLPEAFEPIPIEGEPLSETVIRMRRGE